MDARAWVATVDSLSHHDRVKRAVALGVAARGASKDPTETRSMAARDDRSAAEASAIVGSLARSESPYERRLAVASAFGSNDGALVLELVSDRSRVVRSLALRLVATACDDEQAFAACSRAFEMNREKALLEHLARRGRWTVVDRFLDWLAERQGEARFADLLTIGSADCVQRHLARALARPSQKFWTRLAVARPVALARVLEARIRAASGDTDDVTRQLVAKHLASLAARAPDACLSLVDAMLAKRSRPDPLVFSRLSRARPEATRALLVSYSIALEVSPTSSKRALDALSDEAFARLAVESPSTINNTDSTWWVSASNDRRRLVAAAWLANPAIDPRWGLWALALCEPGAARDAAYEQFSVAMRDNRGVIATTALDRLPDDLREREAWRHIREVSALHTQKTALAQYARHLSYDDAATVCADLLAHPEGEMRCVALAVLLDVAGRRSEVALVERALALVTARKFEQDPVRLVMLRALADWPKERLALAPLATLAQIVRDALDASDLSDATAQCAERIVLRCFAKDAAWSSQWLATLFKERGRIYDYAFGRFIDAADIATCGPMLLALAKSWAARERSVPLVRLASSLGDKLPLVDGFTALLCEHATNAVWPEVSLPCAMLVARFDATRFDATLDAILARWLDRRWFSTITALASQFGANHGLAWRPALSDALEQVVRRAPTLSEVESALRALRSGDRDGFEARLGAMLAGDPSLIVSGFLRTHLHLRRQELLEPYVAGRVITGRFATGLTSWVLSFRDGFFRWNPAMNIAYASALERVLDDPERDTPTLISCVSTLPLLPYADVRALLARTSDERPALREKSIRVLARCDAGQGLSKLVECLGDERARFAAYALSKALSDLPATQALGVLERAPMHKVTVAKEALRLLGALRADEAYARLLSFDANSKLHRDVRIALLRALWTHLERPEPWAIYERAAREGDWVTASRVGDIPADYLTETSDRRLSALLALVLERPDVEARLALLGRAASVPVRDPDRVFLRAIVARLPSMYVDEVQAAARAMLFRARDTDLSLVGEALSALSVDRRAFGETVRGLLSIPIRQSLTWRRLCLAIIEALQDDPRHASTCVRIAARSLDGPALAQWIEGRAALGAIHAEALFSLRDAVAQLFAHEVEPFASTLAASSHPYARRVALWGRGRGAGPGGGRTQAGLKLLRALRDDRDPMVSAAACDVFPPREVDPG